jgi:translation initiation factor IF-3
VNERIRASEVRVIDPDGEQLGVMALDDARHQADERGLDLIEVAPDARPPVCRIMDYGKFRYEQTRRQKEAQKKTKAAEMKAIRIRPTTDVHDVDTKTKRAVRFLQQGNKVKFDMIFRGFELRHTEIGRQMMLRVAEACKGHCEVERPPRMEGRRMLMILAPLKQEQRAGRESKGS